MPGVPGPGLPRGRWETASRRLFTPIAGAGEFGGGHLRMLVLALICSLKPRRSILLRRVLRVAKREIGGGRREVLGVQVGLLRKKTRWQESLFAQAGLGCRQRSAKYFSAPLFSYSFLLLTQDLNLMFCKASHASFVFTGQRGCDGVFQDTLPSHPILTVLEIISKSKWPQGAQTQRNL